jgi:hypothetical protein
VKEASHFYLLRARPPPTLKKKYQDPHLVLKKQIKYFTPTVWAAVETVSVDRLKALKRWPLAEPATPPLRGRPSLFRQEVVEDLSVLPLQPLYPLESMLVGGE